LPPRSRLYPLKPIGIGTPFVESLSGYVSRLADAHGVSVGDLLGRELSTPASKPLLRFSQGFYSQGYSINGLGIRCRESVDALERATVQADLRFLTLLPLKGFLSPIPLFRHTRAWCPECYEHWRVSAHVVYEPLLWAIAPVTICLLHRRALEEICPHCQRRIMPLAVYSRPGHCSRCQQWLGDSKEIRSWGRSNPPDRESDASLWKAQVIGELFAATPRLSSPCLNKVFISNFRACVDTVAEGNQDAFAEAARVSRTAVGSRMRGEVLPEIDTLLRICYHLQIPLTAFLGADPASATVLWQRAKRSVQAGRKLPLSRTPEHVRCTLEGALHERPSPSVAEIARRLGYRGVERLYQVDRNLCKRIVANHRRSGQSHWWRKPGATRICKPTEIRKMLERSLAEEQPISVRNMAASLGYLKDAYIRKRFPDLCRAISQKITAQKIARLATIKNLLGEAMRENPVPTLRDLAKRVGFAGSASLRSHFPELCRQIHTRRRIMRHRWAAELRRTLQATLRESPAPSFTSVCKRIGLSRSCVQETWPRQCAAIESRYLRDRREASQRRKDQMREEVRQIVRELHRQGKCPSVERVLRLLGESTLRDWKALHAAVRAARQDLAQPH
jgi:transcriptional regulator with XRE-family HTH domain